MATIAAAERRPIIAACVPPRIPALAAPFSRTPSGAAIAITRPAFKGFGFVRYAQTSGISPIVLQPGVPALFQMTVDPTQTIAAARAPFDQATFWDGATLKTPHPNDLLDLRIGLTATASVAGGKLTVETDLVVGGAALATAYADLPDQAGTPERVTLFLPLFAGASFATNGVRFFLKSSVLCQVQNETLVVEPQSSGA